MPVLQAAVTDPPARQVPASADGLDGFESAQGRVCSEAVENELALPITRGNQGKLFDHKIVGLALELHR